MDKAPGATLTRGLAVDKAPGATPTRGLAVDKEPGATSTRGGISSQVPPLQKDWSIQYWHNDMLFADPCVRHQDTGQCGRLWRCYVNKRDHVMGFA